MTPKDSTRARAPWWLAGALALALGAGCGGRSAAPSDADEGRKALQTALDAWKGGETPDALARRTPPIHVTDGDWMGGLRLQRYRADDGGRLVGTDVNYNVVLELKTAKGKVVKKNAVYAVTTHPQLLVHRQDNF
jgi:hypothetical protein